MRAVGALPAPGPLAALGVQVTALVRKNRVRVSISKGFPSGVVLA